MRTSNEIAVHVDHLVKSYADVKALNRATLQVGRGEIVALLGPNGAGKTTLVKCLLGLTNPSGGQITIFGNSPKDRLNRMRIGAMLQVGKIPPTLRVREHIQLFSSYYPKPLPIEKTLEIA